MTTAIESPKDPQLPPASNELYIADSWQNVLNGEPSFSCELRERTDKESFTPLLGFSIAMTKDQWAKWGSDDDDEEYIKNCVCENKGLVRKDS